MENIQINHESIDVSIKEIVAAHKSVRPKGFSFKQINRNSYGFVLTLSGSAVYDYGHKKITASKDTVLFVRKGDSYNVNIPWDDGWAHIIVAFDLWIDEDITHFPFEDTNRISHPKLFEDIFTEICKIYNSGAVSKLKLKALVYELFSTLLESRTEEIFKESKYRGILAAARFIEVNYREKISVKTLSEISGYSISHFPRLFKDIYSVSPKEYIINTRINRAKNMLRGGIFTLTEIAEECGFGNVYYFSKVFKKFTGTTPKNY